MSGFSFFYDCFRQTLFVPKPTFTDKSLPSQAGRVFIVTGGYAGVGKELSSILYSRNGTVYVAGRSKAKGDSAIADIKQAHPSSDGRIEFLQLDLADLTTIKASAEAFLAKEQRLDVLTNNAGVMMPPKGSVTTQGFELQMGTNCVGPWLFTHYLTPILKQTAANSPKGSVRVTWAASLATSFSPTGGVAFDEKTGAPGIASDVGRDYAQTKAGNVLLSREWEDRFGSSGVISNAWNPGNLRSELSRHGGAFQRHITDAILLFPTVYGAYTELFAGWSEEAGKPENARKYIGPWGRFVLLRKDIDESKVGKRFWEWCESESAKYSEL